MNIRFYDLSIRPHSPYQDIEEAEWAIPGVKLAEQDNLEQEPLTLRFHIETSVFLCHLALNIK